MHPSHIASLQLPVTRSGELPPFDVYSALAHESDATIAALVDDYE